MKMVRKKNSLTTDKAVSATLGTALLICCFAGLTAGCSANNKGNSSTNQISDFSEYPYENSDHVNLSDDTKYNSSTGLLSTSESTIDPAILELQDEFDNELALIPEGHLNFLKERGWRFELTTKDLAKEYNYTSYICGITLFDEKVVYIDADEWAIRRSTIHEIGHAIGFELGWVESGEEFREIYDEEKDYFSDCTAVGDGHEVSNVYEYFASVYQNMILDYDETKTEIPQTVEYIEKCLAMIQLKEISDNI